MRKIMFAIIITISLQASGQYTVSGLILDSKSGEPLPNVTVVVKGTVNGTVTDLNGRFIIGYDEIPYTISASYIGYNSQDLKIFRNDTIVIQLQEREEPEFKDWKIKNKLGVGYYADVLNAPYGFMINYSLQNFYRFHIPINVNYKYWTNNGKTKNTDLLIGYDLKTKHNLLPDNFYLAYTRFDYETNYLDFTQTRSMLSNEWKRVAFDYGFSYNQLDSTDSDYIALVIGLSYRLSSYFSFLGNIGLHADLNYHPDYFYYSAGIYKEFWIRNFTSIMISAKYFNYDQFDGFFLSLSFGLLNTRSYWCCSWRPYYYNMNTLK